METVLYLSTTFPITKLPLRTYQPVSEQRHQNTMSKIPKHDGEEERECDESVQGRIHFLVISHSICINDGLETVCELICPIESRGCLFRFHLVNDGGYCRIALPRPLFQSVTDVIKVGSRCPTFSDKSFRGDINIEHVHGMVDSFDLLHLLFRRKRQNF